ncbi:MAG: hypothetical protein HY694_01745 [Deltaproteobacteria bacterium]|nr:hypothetical protein [Deltaproteobacteria bacterium]
MSIADPLNHITAFGYDTKGNLTSITQSPDSVRQLQTTFQPNPAGQPIFRGRIKGRRSEASVA